MEHNYDLIVIGAGSGGITAVDFAAKLGAKVALVEKERLGGDCTWTGCVPSKALLKAAKIAHESRTSEAYGIFNNTPNVDMAKVRDYVQSKISDVYQLETPDIFENKGVDVIIGEAKFINAHAIEVNGQTLTAKKFILATGAHPFIPSVPGLHEVPYLTHMQIFDNDVLPERLIIIGAGPIGTEMAQAYQRLGAEVVMIGSQFLPKEEPEVVELMCDLLAREGLKYVKGRVTAVRMEGDQYVVTVDDNDECQGDMLLVAAGRRPNVTSLDLAQAGVEFSEKGIPVDKYLRTNQKHIYAVGDCIAGNYQFTHLAGWQGFQAARNILLPLNDKGFTEVLPWVTFTDPEVAHVGLTEAQAREIHGDNVQVTRWEMDHTDRAISEDDAEGFVKVIHQKNGRILGATIVAGRAGEIITEYAVAMVHNLKLIDLGKVVHPYPTYSVANMQLAGEATINGLLDGSFGPLIKQVSKLTR